MASLPMSGADKRCKMLILSDMKDGDFQVHRFSYDWIMETYGRGDYAKQLRTARANAAQDKQIADYAFS
ncbi:hypothetical protein ACEWPM_015805 [Roseovarius sp. S4756]|uniref:hypothetical protein n=1 Tax=Roseovarius maritimus TaxID=3342637 RepID=UPI003726E64A